MSLLTVANQVTTCLLDPLCESQGSYAPKNNRLPRSVWYNTTSLAYRHDGACRLAVEAAEEHSFRIHQLMTHESWTMWLVGRGLQKRKHLDQSKNRRGERCDIQCETAGVAKYERKCNT